MKNILLYSLSYLPIPYNTVKKSAFFMALTVVVLVSQSLSAQATTENKTFTDGIHLMGGAELVEHNVVPEVISEAKTVTDNSNKITKREKIRQPKKQLITQKKAEKSTRKFPVHSTQKINFPVNQSPLYFSVMSGGSSKATLQYDNKLVIANTVKYSRLTEETVNKLVFNNSDEIAYYYYLRFFCRPPPSDRLS